MWFCKISNVSFFLVRFNHGSIQTCLKNFKKSSIASIMTQDIRISKQSITLTLPQVTNIMLAIIWMANGTVSKWTLLLMKVLWQLKLLILVTSPCFLWNDCSLSGLNLGTCLCKLSTQVLQVNKVFDKTLKNYGIHLKIFLPDIVAINGDWTTEDTLWFSERVVNQQFVSRIRDVIYDPLEENIKLCVSLIDTTHPTTDIYIEKQLVDDKKAVYLCV